MSHKLRVVCCIKLQQTNLESKMSVYLLIKFLDRVLGYEKSNSELLRNITFIKFVFFFASEILTI